MTFIWSFWVLVHKIVMTVPVHVRKNSSIWLDHVNIAPTKLCVSPALQRIQFAPNYGNSLCNWLFASATFHDVNTKYQPYPALAPVGINQSVTRGYPQIVLIIDSESYLIFNWFIQRITGGESNSTQSVFIFNYSTSDAMNIRILTDLMTMVLLSKRTQSLSPTGMWPKTCFVCVTLFGYDCVLSWFDSIISNTRIVTSLWLK